jgi:hypothetical protein
MSLKSITERHTMTKFTETKKSRFVYNYRSASSKCGSLGVEATNIFHAYADYK